MSKNHDQTTSFHLLDFVKTYLKISLSENSHYSDRAIQKWLYYRRSAVSTKLLKSAQKQLYQVFDLFWNSVFAQNLILLQQFLFLYVLLQIYDYEDER